MKVAPDFWLPGSCIGRIQLAQLLSLRSRSLEDLADLAEAGMHGASTVEGDILTHVSPYKHSL